MPLLLNSYTMLLIFYVAARNQAIQIEGRCIIIDRYRIIVDTLFVTYFNPMCPPDQTNGNVIADVTSSGQGNPANVRLFQAWFELLDENRCGEQRVKANVLVHEASHMFGAADHGKIRVMMLI